MNRFNFLKLLYTVLFITQVYSCAALDHRDFEDTMSPYANTGDMAFIPNEDFPVVAGDEGEYGGGLDVIISRTPGYKKEKKVLSLEESLKAELARLENRLEEREQRDYLEHREELGSDSSRIYYLSLDKSEKYHYLRLKGLKSEPLNTYYSRRDRAIASLTNDIVLGMTKSDVSRLWGAPARVDYAGSKGIKGERWAYSRDEKVKFIYFSGGRVEGWAEQ